MVFVSVLLSLLLDQLARRRHRPRIRNVAECRPVGGQLGANACLARIDHGSYSAAGAPEHPCSRQAVDAHLGRIHTPLHAYLVRTAGDVRAVELDVDQIEAGLAGHIAAAIQVGIEKRHGDCQLFDVARQAHEVDLGQTQQLAANVARRHLRAVDEELGLLAGPRRLAYTRTVHFDGAHWRVVAGERDQRRVEYRKSVVEKVQRIFACNLI